MSENILDKIKRHMLTYPVDVYAVAHDLGIKVRKITMPANHSARIRLDRSTGQYHIDVNIRDPETRQRFSVAHEIGHYLYHRDLIGDGVSDSPAFRSPDPNVYIDTPLEQHHETQANRFAANLLMPKGLVAKVERDLGAASLEMVAEALKVSLPAMRVRKGLPPYPDAQEMFDVIEDE